MQSQQPILAIALKLVTQVTVYITYIVLRTWRYYRFVFDPFNGGATVFTAVNVHNRNSILEKQRLST